MGSKDILLKKAPVYIGYQLQTIAKTIMTPEEIGMKRLQRIPAKISRFLDKAKIKEVFKSDCFKPDVENYYIVRAIDGTLFQLEY